jgi:predicted house-cleaning noncanonical NTP pyrophosphatase (MazG superfamily)
VRLVKIVRSQLGLDIGNNGTIEYRDIDDHEEILDALHQHLGEELVEYLKSPGVDELGDLLATLQGLAHHQLRVPWTDVEATAAEKASRKGDFIRPVGMYVSTLGRID